MRAADLIFRRREPASATAATAGAATEGAKLAGTGAGLGAAGAAGATAPELAALGATGAEIATAGLGAGAAAGSGLGAGLGSLLSSLASNPSTYTTAASLLSSALSGQGGAPTLQQLQVPQTAGQLNPLAIRSALANAQSRGVYEGSVSPETLAALTGIDQSQLEQYLGGTAGGPNG